jgi:hypothetical protein
MNLKTRVTGTNGKRMTLMTDDTLTLTFPGMIESTPETLSERVSLESLENIVNGNQDDLNIVNKAYDALCLSRKSRN